MHSRRSGLVVVAAAAAVGVLALPASAHRSGSAQAAQTVRVSAGTPSEFLFKLSKTVVPLGTVTFVVTNDGAIVHDFAIAGKKTRNLSPGQSQTIRVTFRKAGNVRYLCTVTGHAAAGMKGVLRVRGGAAPVRVNALLNKAQERPRPTGTRVGASGRLTGTLTGKSLKWRLTFTRLSGKATAAHLHLAPRGKAGPVIEPLCAPCSSPRVGTALLTTSQVAALKKQRVYVNVHTARNPKGEIRGQIGVSGL
jgi:uncharacterized cupredoxin-like copper-binding protein